MLNVTLSNKFEILLGGLLDKLRDSPESPFAATQIIVPSAAIRRKVTLAIADRFGICANTEFSFLAQWLWKQIGKIVPVDEVSPFAPPVLSWRVFRLLEDPSFTSIHPRLSSYLGHADDVMRRELACRIASLMDQYVTYRSDWLDEWLEDRPARMDGAQVPGETPRLSADKKWQADLWRRIAGESGITRRHPASVFFESLEALGPAAAEKLHWPGTVHVFCLPSMPPQYLEIIRHLEQWIDLQLYVLNPCREYWFEIIDPKRLSYLAAKSKTGNTGYHETGNRLLAAWGKQTQAHLDLLFSDAMPSCTEDSLFAANAETEAGTSLLARLQDAILDLTDLPPAGIRVPEGDRSIEVHVCHSLTRELEVLQDQLLAMFAGPNPPHPGEILVITPDLDKAAPSIEAIFGNATAGRRIPYLISGLGQSQVNPVARALLDLLGIVSSRFTADSVISLLRQPVIASRFFLADGLEAIHTWLAESGICWGLNGTHREEFGLPCGDAHSFEDGLHRLFMGYAFPASSGEPFNGRIPAGNAEGKAAAALGCLWHFMQQLQSLRSSLSRPMPASQWLPVLTAAIDTFMKLENDQIDDRREVLDRIRQLQENMEHGCGEHPVSLGVIRVALADALDDPSRGGVPSGSVTFSSMSSLRNLPYRILCAIGLEDGSFPTADKPTEFDLIALFPRRGDRQRRHDERNLFLDILLSARERLYLSYTGRSVRDNSVRPPSVLVSELLDYVSPAIAHDTSAASVAIARGRLVVEHPLQPFSSIYFDGSADPRLASCNEEYCIALATRQNPAPSGLPRIPLPANEPEDDDESDGAEMLEAGQPFFREPLPAPGPEWHDVNLDQLIRFFRNPCRYLLCQRMGMAFQGDYEELPQHEPFLPDWRMRTRLADRLLPLFLEGRGMDEIRACASAGTDFPGGAVGTLMLEQELASLASFADNLAADCREPLLPPHEETLGFMLDGQAWTLRGSFGDLRASGLVRHRYDETRAVDYLSGWIEHLFLNALSLDSAQKCTAWHSRDGCFRLRPCPNAYEHLSELLRLYRDGLQKPLHFFPRSAWAYATSGNNPKKAGERWKSPGEGDDPSYRLALRGTANPLDSEFIHCARTLFEPLQQVIDDGRLK